MKRYRIWLDPFEVVSKYGMKFLNLPPSMQETYIMKQKCKMCECLQFKVNGKVEEMFNIYEIDSLFAGYKSKEEFLQKLEQFPNEKYKRKTKNNLLVTYQYKEELKQLELVFNNPLLQTCAILTRTEKNKKGSFSLQEKERLQEQLAKEFQKLLNRLLNIVENKETRAYIFSPLDVESLTPSEQLKKLSQYLPDPQIFDIKDPVKYRQIYQNSLYQSLFLYAKAFDAKEEKERLYLSTSEEDSNLLTHKTNVSRLLKKDYRTLRNAILFINTFEEIRTCEKEELAKIEDENENYKQLKLYFSSPNSVTVLDPDTQARCDEIERIQKENADLLKKYADDEKIKWQNRYKEDDIVEDDGYSFEELDMQNSEEPKTSFTKGKGLWINSKIS